MNVRQLKVCQKYIKTFTAKLTLNKFEKKMKKKNPLWIGVNLMINSNQNNYVLIFYDNILSIYCILEVWVWLNIYIDIFYNHSICFNIGQIQVFFFFQVLFIKSYPRACSVKRWGKKEKKKGPYLLEREKKLVIPLVRRGSVIWYRKQQTFHLLLLILWKRKYV